MDLQIIKIASENKNQKYLKNYTHRIKSKNSLCGDEITLSLLLKNEVIKKLVMNVSLVFFVKHQ